MAKVRARYNFTARSEKELSFNKGDVITVTDQDEEWWYGEIDGKEGLLPSNYVEVIEEKPSFTLKLSQRVNPRIRKLQSSCGFRNEEDGTETGALVYGMGEPGFTQEKKEENSHFEEGIPRKEKDEQNQSPNVSEERGRSGG